MPCYGHRPITSRLFGEETGEAGSDWWAEEGPSIMSCVFRHLALLRFGSVESFAISVWSHPPQEESRGCLRPACLCGVLSGLQGQEVRKTGEKQPPSLTCHGTCGEPSRYQDT